MLQNDQLQLITMTYTLDDYGIQRETEQTETIFCNASSISEAEFYDAAQTGLRAQYRFIILAAEYAGQKLVRFNGEDLSVYRTFRRSRDYIELYTERRAGNNGD